VILGLGIDLVSVPRIREIRERHGERFLARVFTEAEAEECLRRKSPDEGLAARFAAKEAALKALGTGVSAGIGWRDVEVSTGASGAPELRLRNRALEGAGKLGATHWLVSLTHDGGYAGAVVVLEGEKAI
jgi:holo-[acyl-carrier protein] synthase